MDGDGIFLCNSICTGHLGSSSSTGILTFEDGLEIDYDTDDVRLIFVEGAGAATFTGGTGVEAGITGSVSSVYSPNEVAVMGGSNAHTC